MEKKRVRGVTKMNFRRAADGARAEKLFMIRLFRTVERSERELSSQSWYERRWLIY
jgi:hypothetical protein